MPYDFPIERDPGTAPGGHRLVRNALDYDQITSANNLIAAYDLLRLEGGQAPGPDQIRYRDLNISEVCEICRFISRLLQAEPMRYRPGPARLTARPKRDGGFRMLAIRSIFDRVIAKAVEAALSPILDRLFLPCSFAYRPGRSPAMLLAHLSRQIQLQGMTWFMQDDISHAFDSIRIDQVVEDYERHVSDTRLLRLIEVILRGDDPHKPVGIDQGGPLSPSSLNLHLHHRLDGHLLWEDVPPTAAYVRFSDNVAWTARTAAETRDLHANVEQILHGCGLTLKSLQSRDPNLGRLVDLSREHTTFLGLQIATGTQGQLLCDLTRQAWKDLNDKLLDCHRIPNGHRHAQRVLDGWIRAYGPAFRTRRHRDRYTQQIRNILMKTGAADLFSADRLIRSTSSSYQNWLRTVTHAASDTLL